MLVPLSWLKQWVEIDITPEELSERLAFTGLEVEEIEGGGETWEKVVVGHIQRIEPHPDADKLVVCQVDTGEGEHRQIVCGASNMVVGDRVPVALPGARLGETKIKKSKLRGVVSQGMMCSPRELGLGTEHAGLMILDPATAVGSPIADVLGRGDTVLELGITANRGDCLSIRGLAREIGILLNRPLTPPASVVTEAGPSIDTLTSVTLEDPVGCPRYTCRVIENVTIGPSPRWLADAVTACGMRPINNVVDATNYVMLELGQPLHAFDISRLKERRIVVRRAAEGEKVVTLDDVERTLDAEMTVICDAEDVVAVAGVMGAAGSAVADSTTTLLLESAYFAPDGIRRTSRVLKLASESSYRFARGVDVQAVPVALDRLTQIIHELAGGTVAVGRCDAYPTPLVPPTIRFRFAQIERVLGVDIDPETATAQLESLGCQVTGGGEIRDVTVPPWRSDLTREIDLIEEVARLTGYERIPTTLPTGAGHRDATPPAAQPPAERVRDALAAAGLSEVIPFRFGPADDPLRLGFDEEDAEPGIRLLNPMSEDKSVMRTELFPSLLRVGGANQRNGNLDLGLFEVGPVFRREDGEPRELLLVGGVLAGRREIGNWAGTDRDADVYDAKGMLELLVDVLGLTDTSWHEGDRPYFAAGAQAALKVGAEVVGWVGEVKPEVLAAFDAREPMFGFLLNLDRVASLAPDRVGYTPFGRFPPALRVRTYDVPERVLGGELTAALLESGGDTMERAELTDVYRGENLPEGVKSLSFALSFRASDRTLTDSEVEAAIARMDRAAAARCGASVREA